MKDENIFSLWKLSIRLNTKAQNIVLKKFDSYLHKFCKEEQIKVVFYDKLEDLNEGDILNKKDNEIAVGLYTRRVNKMTQETIIDDEYPKISLTNDYNIFVFAHEVGHHLAIKNFKDRSENIASSFIVALAEECLTNIERYIISISLYVHSHLEQYPLPKITRKEWRAFKREQKINNNS
jgi:hypothetical protein